MRMTAAVMYEQGLPQPFATSQPWRIEEVELEGPGDGEVLVEIRAAGLCHSDLSVIEGLRTRPSCAKWAAVSSVSRKATMWPWPAWPVAASAVPAWRAAPACARQ
jgi:NADPH:quinone reductase-like Zn-dependent oxidoreductase